MFRTVPKHVEFYSKNKLEKLVHIVGFIIRSLLIIATTLLLTEMTATKTLWTEHTCTPQY